MKYKIYKIYQIVCNETGEVYYGKTIQTLNKRLSKHKELGCSSRKIIERNNYYINQIVSTFDEKESIKLERYYIETFECVNKCIPGRNRQESQKECRKKYRESHKNEKKEINRKYRESHKEEIKESQKEIYTCECGSTLSICGKSQHENTQKHKLFKS